MKIPEFKPSRDYFNEIKLSCLVAKIANSGLPRVAARHIEVHKKDPVCKIYLRGPKPNEISAWQKEMLERLLEKEELPSALGQGLKEYETSKAWAGYEKAVDEELYGDIQRYGIVPHLTVSAIVIDEVQQEVIIAAETEWDGHLDEHGITVFLKDGSWRFGFGDRQHDYSEPILGELEGKRGKNRVVEDIFPKPEAGASVETDVSFLFGTWELDEEAMRILLPQLGFTKQNAEHDIEFNKGLAYKISNAKFEMQSFDEDTEKTFTLATHTLVKAERSGHQVTLHFFMNKDATRTEIYFYKDGVLFNEVERVAMRKKL